MRKILYVVLICICLFLLTIQGFSLAESSDMDSRIYGPSLIPVLRWEPKSHDFGYVQEGTISQTTFDIWNNGTGDMVWVLHVRSSYVAVSPSSGSSTGEKDTITVTIDTTGLECGSYEGNVFIHSEGDYIFYTYFVVTDSQLAVSPSQIDLVYTDDSQVSSLLQLWNEGAGEILWDCVTSDPWISVEPSNGVATQNRQDVIVTIDGSKLNSTLSSGEIFFQSTGGDIMVPVNVRKNTPPSKPMIDGPDTVKIGMVVPFQFSSVDGEDDPVYYSIDWGDDIIDNWLGPYDSGKVVHFNHTWDKRGSYSITCKAKDAYDAESMDASYSISTTYIQPYDLLSRLLLLSFLLD